MSTAKQMKALPDKPVLDGNYASVKFRELCKLQRMDNLSIPLRADIFPCTCAWLRLEVHTVLKNKKGFFFFFFFCHALPLVSPCCPVLFTCHCLCIQQSLNVTGDVESCLRYAETFQARCLDSASDCESADAFQSQIPRESLERDLTEKSHKTSFKGHTEIACLSSTTSSFLLPHFLIALPLLLRFIHTSDGRDGGTPAGRREGVHLQAIPLRGRKIASIWIECQQPGASSPQTASAPCPHPCDSPHQILLQASSLAVCHLCPAVTQAGALPLWVIFPPEPL